MASLSAYWTQSSAPRDNRFQNYRPIDLLKISPVTMTFVHRVIEVNYNVFVIKNFAHLLHTLVHTKMFLSVVNPCNKLWRNFPCICPLDLKIAWPDVCRPIRMTVKLFSRSSAIVDRRGQILKVFKVAFCPSWRQQFTFKHVVFQTESKNSRFRYRPN